MLRHATNGIKYGRDRSDWPNGPMVKWPRGGAELGPTNYVIKNAAVLADESRHIFSPGLEAILLWRSSVI